MEYVFVNNINNINNNFIRLLGIDGEELECNINNNMKLNDVKTFIINNTTTNYINNIDFIRIYFGDEELEDGEETLDFHNIQVNSCLNFKYDIIEVDLKIHVYYGISSLRTHTIYVPSNYDVYSTIKNCLGYENISNDLLNMTIYNDIYSETIIDQQKKFENIESNTLNIIFVELEKSLKTWGINSSANILKNYLLPRTQLNNAPFPQLNGTAYYWYNWHMIIDCYILNIWINILKINSEEEIINNLYKLDNIKYNDNEIVIEFNKQTNSKCKIDINSIITNFEYIENTSSLSNNFKYIYQQQTNNITNYNISFIEFYKIMNTIIIDNKQTKIVNDSIFIDNIQTKLLKPWNFLPSIEFCKFKGPLL